MQIGRHFLESQIVIAVAVCAAPFVNLLPFDLLGSELWRHTADGEVATGLHLAEGLRAALQTFPAWPASS